MKQAMIDFMRQGHTGEDYDTPPEAVGVLRENLLLHGTQPVIWEPCDPLGVSAITAVFGEAGYRVTATGLPETDFLKQRKPPKGVGCIITNPPYSRKDDFLDRCFRLGLPFCLLLPLTALEGIRRGALFGKYGIQVLVLNRRMQFITGKSVPFNTSWFCWSPCRPLLKRDLVFARVPEIRQAA